MKEKNKVGIVIGVAIAAVAAVFSGVLFITGGTFDVIGREAILSFGKVLETGGVVVAADERNAGWSLEAPDGSTRFIWSGDDSRSPSHDVMLEFDAQPFLDAGLDLGKLPENYTFYEGRLAIGMNYVNDGGSFSYEEGTPPFAAFENLEKNDRGKIGYHVSLGHYNVSLGDDNQFEWAQDMAANDKDIVFSLNPKPLIGAGVNPEQVEGWLYTEVSVGHSGSSETVWKFLKPFDIK